MSVVKIIAAAFMLAAAIAFAVLAGLTLYTKSYAAVSGTDKFELFRDLLLVLLALAAAIGAAMYHLVREYVKKEIMAEAKEDINQMTQSARKEISKERGKSLINYGITNWEMGKILRAINRTEEALKEEGLEDWNVVKAKNNLAYYLASHYKATQVEQLISKALKLADEVYATYDITNDNYNEPEWVETWVFVKLCAARTLEEKKSLRDIIIEFILRDDLADIKRKLEEYKRYLEQDGREG